MDLSREKNISENIAQSTPQTQPPHSEPVVAQTLVASPGDVSIDNDFVSTSLLANEFNYDPDHIGLLLRQGKVRGRKDDKRWLVSRASLVSYRNTVEEKKALRASVSKSLTVLSKALSQSADLSAAALAKADRPSGGSVTTRSKKDRAVRLLPLGLLLLLLSGFGFALVGDFVTFRSKTPSVTYENSVREELSPSPSVAVISHSPVVAEPSHVYVQTLPATPLPSPIFTIPSFWEQRFSFLQQQIDELQNRTPTINISQTLPLDSYPRIKSNDNKNSNPTVFATYYLSGHNLDITGTITQSGTGAVTLGGAVSMGSGLSVAGDLEVAGYASSSATYGSGLSDCDTAGSSKLLWDASSGNFSCGTDQTSGGVGVTSNSLDFDEFVNSATLDANLTINRSASNYFIGIGATPSTVLEVQGTASASYLLAGNTLQVGGYASATYSRFGTSPTTHSNYISSSNDLLINGDLEIDASATFDGNLAFYGEIMPDGDLCSDGQILKKTGSNDWDCAADAGSSTVASNSLGFGAFINELTLDKA
ncbi:MAG: hypothetical protein AAB420_02820, partial [Patescibacteria group bacterium]